ncbi:MAG: metal-dependent transcriptional regulator [Microscillaceae bacterium]|jgi:DtxR family Mn-dependent transcriptional regulator|nr:metal-dependent transcriptional regulator [Microscillaceae bacterium]
MHLSLTEEDYLKAIFHLSDPETEGGISTNDIAKKIDISAASVSDMIKKLSQKGLINYVKYQGVTLTESGRKQAIYLVRKHRLWETFLVQKLKFNWDEVHEIAEQLEHIDSQVLITRLDEYLNYPEFDPHGDPIPNEKGEIVKRKRISLKNAPLNEKMQVIAVEETSPLFLKHLDKIKINIGTELLVLEKSDYDESIEIELAGNRVLMISKDVAENLYVSKLN